MRDESGNIILTIRIPPAAIAVARNLILELDEDVKARLEVHKLLHRKDGPGEWIIHPDQDRIKELKKEANDQLDILNNLEKSAKGVAGYDDLESKYILRETVEPEMVSMQKTIKAKDEEIKKLKGNSGKRT